MDGGWKTVLLKSSKLAPLRGMASQQVSAEIQFSRSPAFLLLGLRHA
jgi:hypothetical protein